MWQKIKIFFDKKVVKPFRDSKSPTKEVALGAMIGMFWAMTPLVGLQMTLVTIMWIAFKFIRIRFSIPVGMAMVWLSNPFTMGPLYYLFYISGFYSFKFFGSAISQISYENFTNKLDESLAMSAIDGTVDFITYVTLEMGWPMLIGGFVVATPLSIASYFIAYRFVNRHRIDKAKKEGLSLAEWEHKHVRGHPLPQTNQEPGT